MAANSRTIQKTHLICTKCIKRNLSLLLHQSQLSAHLVSEKTLLPEFGEELVDIVVTIVRHEEHMFIFKLQLGFVPLQLGIPGPRENEAV